MQSDSIFNVLARYAKLGQTISFRISSAPLERSGILRELLPNGMVIETDSGVEWVSAQDICTWGVPKQSQPATNIIQQATPSSTHPLPKEFSMTSFGTKDAPPPTSIQSISKSSGGLPSTPPEDLKLIFTGIPVIELPKPSFDIPLLSKDIQQEVTRWKNKYDYAIKVHEPARLNQDVARIAELAESLRQPNLYYLAGLLADFSGLSNARIKMYFENTLALNQDHQEAATAAAAIAIRDSNWETATKFLFWSIRLDGSIDKESLVRWLGQCTLRVGRENIPLLGPLLEYELPETARYLATKLIALLAQEDPDAYRAALAGDISQLRKTKFGNNLFPWRGEVTAPIQQDLPRLTQVTNINNHKRHRRGRVSAYFTHPRNFGFIVEESTGQTWFFRKTSIISTSLLTSLLEGTIRQDVTFLGNTTSNIESQPSKYPLASDIATLSKDASVQVDVIKRAPLRQRLQAIPRDGSYFAKAMEAEQLDQLDRAESFYQKSIEKEASYTKSAIKNYAALKNRKGDSQTAIGILDKYKNLFDTTEFFSLDQMRVQFLVKDRKYPDAAQLLSKLAKSKMPTEKRINLIRQEAYCLFASGDFDESIKKLNSIIGTHPDDYASQLLLAKVREAKQTGIIPIEFTTNRNEEEQGDLLSSLALGLSPIARRQIENCELRGIDTRTKESGSFTVQDVKQVQSLLDGVKGRRPRERADYLLTLAWLCEHASNLTANKSVHEYLRRHFLAVAEAVMSEDAHKDIVRCYALESLVLCPIRFEEKSDSRNSFEAAWVLLLGTYLSDPIEPSALLQPSTRKRLPNVLSLLKKHPNEWQQFVNDTAFYQIKAPSAYNHLLLFLNSGTPLNINDIDSTNERIQLEKIKRAFKSIPTDLPSADRLRQPRDILAQCIHSIRFELDRKRLLDFVKILGDSADYALERHFREREPRFLRLDTDISRSIDDLHCYPTHLSIEHLSPALSSLRKLLSEDFSRLGDTKPVLELRNVLDNDFYVLNDGTVALRLLLASKDESSPPIEAIGLVLEQEEGEPCHSPEPLHGGQTREIELTIRPTEQQVIDGTFTVSVIVEYRTRKGSQERSSPFALAVRLGNPSSFNEIPNPYGRYSGGTPVDVENMFFGRTALIKRIAELLSFGEMGQCFVLYGQKRSGKSSVLKQVEKRLEKSVLFTAMSAGTFAPDNLWGSFARLLLQELTFRLEDNGESIPENWPSRSDVEQRPLETIRDISRDLFKRGQRIIIAIDEFTYIYEHPSDAIQTFMRGWKALLEARTFNALLIGQDTMPRFMQAFPNEFGVVHDERITYLTDEEASSLASQPILLNEQSRYRGQALHRLFDLTAGSPFFLQISCDRLVRHLNARKAAFITEADIEQVGRTLTLGGDALPPERFDALVTAAGEKVASVPRDDLWRILARVARESLHSGWSYKTALAELPRSTEAVKDLIDREILAAEGERVRIRVGLFAAWLRANQFFETN